VLGAVILVAPVASNSAGATAAPVSSCASPPNTLAAGQQLTAGGCLVSSNQDYELVMQTDGNLVLYYQSQSDPLWDSGTYNDPGAYATMQTDGNFVVYSSSGNALWNAGTQGAPNASLIVQSDGNVVVYGSNPGGSQYAAWATNTDNLRGYELQNGQALEPGQYLESQNGEYGVEMGAGGVLVLFTTAVGNSQGNFRCPMWSEPAITGAKPISYQYNTVNPINGSNVAVGAYPYTGQAATETPVANSYLTMQSDGNLVMYAVGTTPDDSWASGTTANPGAYAELQNDGNFVVYSASGMALWTSYTASGGQNRGWALCTGSTLQIGQRINAVPWSNGNYLTMQSDCNLVLYNSSGTALWSTNTDINESKNFSKSSNNSTLDGLPDNPAGFAYCYAVMQTNGNVVLIAPNCGNNSGGCWPSGAEVYGQFWSSGVLGASVLHTPPGGFGPFLAFPTNGGDVDIVNAAGDLAAKNPVVDNPHADNVKPLEQEIGAYVLMVLGALL
jgi:hypothetical protein